MERLPEWPVFRSCSRSNASPPADFTKNDPVGPMAKSGFQEIADAYRWNPVLSLPGFDANQFVVIHVDFGSVFDKQDSFVGLSEFAKGI